MTKIYFDELYSVVVENLRRAKKEVKIAVAWINFDLYDRIFQYLLGNGVKLNIIINDDFINSRHNSRIDDLTNKGANIKKIRMPHYTNRMHHKLCVIDNRIVLTGSYNWSKNAARNFENLVEINDPTCAKKVNDEFSYIWDTPMEELKILQSLPKCKCCREVELKLLILHLCMDKHENTEYKLVSFCGCDNYSLLENDYLSAGFYYSLQGIIEHYDDMIEQYNDEKNQLEMEFDDAIQSFLTQTFNDKEIDAIGVIKEDVTPFNYETIYTTNIMWKKRFKSAIIEDFYDATFDLV